MRRADISVCVRPSRACTSSGLVSAAVTIPRSIGQRARDGEQDWPDGRWPCVSAAPRRAGSRRARRGPPRAGPRWARACRRRAAARGRAGAGRARPRCRRGARTRRTPRRRRPPRRAETAASASLAGPLEDAAQQRDAREVGGQQRRHEVRAAAVVLLGGVARVVVAGLVGGDRLVLDAVVGGDVAAAQRDERGHERERGHAASPPTPPRARLRRAAPPTEAHGRGGQHPALLEGQPRLGQRALDERDDDHRLAEAHDAARARHALDAPLQARLAAGGDADRAVAAPHGGGPVRRAVHEQAVAQRHAAEAQLVLRERRQAPSRSWRCRGRSACAKPRSRTSMRSSAACSSAAGLVEGHVAMGEEAVGDAVGEGVAERPRVGEGRQHVGHDGAAGPRAADPAADRVHERRVDGRARCRRPPRRRSRASPSPSPPSTSWMRASDVLAPRPGGVRQSTSQPALATG